MGPKFVPGDAILMPDLPMCERRLGGGDCNLYRLVSEEDPLRSLSKFFPDDGILMPDLPVYERRLGGGDRNLNSLVSEEGSLRSLSLTSS